MIPKDCKRLAEVDFPIAAGGAGEGNATGQGLTPAAIRRK
jgi:hypothetical protein